MTEPALSLEGRFVLQHYQSNHSCTDDGKFIVLLPRKPDANQVGKSLSQAIRCLNAHCIQGDSLRTFDVVMRDYLEKGHAERVPMVDLTKSKHNVFYLPMHIVQKESSTNTKIRAVFDASSK